MSTPTLIFEFLHGDQVVRTERIQREFVKVGSLPSSHLQIKDPQVSGIHAVIEVSGDTVHCIDLGSSFGTVVDGQRTNKAELKKGSIIEFGGTRVRFKWDKGRAKAVRGIRLSAEEAKKFQYVQLLNRPSDTNHYSRRFLSQPSRTDGTVEVAHIWRDHVMAEFSLEEHKGLVKKLLRYFLWSRDAASRGAVIFLGYVFYAIWCFLSIPTLDSVGAYLSYGFLVLIYGLVNVVIPVTILFEIYWFFIKSRERKAIPDKSVSIGPNRNNHIILDHPSIPSKRHPLVTRESDGSTYLHLTPEMEGDIFIESSRYDVEEVLKTSGKRGLRVGEKTRARLVFGDNTIYVHQGTKPNLVLPLGAMQAHTALYVFFSILLHGMILALVFLTPPGTANLSIDGGNLQDRLVSIIQMEEEQRPEEIPDLLEQEQPEDDLSIDREAGDEGRAGDQAVPDEGRRQAVEGPRNTRDRNISRREATNIASTRGALSVLNRAGGPQSMFGAVSAAGYDDVSAMGGLYGEMVGHSTGFGGLGLSGGGFSGGGTGPGGYGVGPISTHGRYGGGGDANMGRDQIRMTERARSVEVELGQARVEGHLDREIIQRVIRQNRREIRACYQRELQRRPDIEGRVVVNFSIGPDGSVVGAQIAETSLNDDAVEQCIVMRIRRFRFPEPSTPGIVHVNYPFVFTAGG